MDGARLWQCRPFYQKSYQEIAALFDSVYVSFYKDLGGLCGSVLLGSEAFIRGSRVWLRRHGGNLKTQGPFWASARLGLKRVEPQIDRWVERAREAAEILSQFDRITIRPNPPHVNFFRLYIRGEAEALTERHKELAKEMGTFLFHGLQTAAIPGMATTEMRFEESSLGFDMGELRPFVERLLSLSV
jgi:threonine aldolase